MANPLSEFNPAKLGLAKARGSSRARGGRAIGATIRGLVPVALGHFDFRLSPVMMSKNPNLIFQLRISLAPPLRLTRPQDPRTLAGNCGGMSQHRKRPAMEG